MWVRKEASNGRLEPPPEVAHKAGDKDKTPQVRTTENETLVKIVGQQKKKKAGKQKQEVKDGTRVSIFSPNSGKMK